MTHFSVINFSIKNFRFFLWNLFFIVFPFAEKASNENAKALKEVNEKKDPKIIIHSYFLFLFDVKKKIVPDEKSKCLKKP